MGGPRMITQPAIEVREMRSPRGAPVRFALRDDTTDYNTVNACCSEDEYQTAALHLSGWAMDVGAHIGGMTIGLLADNPDLRVIAVEALPENVEVLRQTLVLNDLDSRAIVISGAADSGREPVQIRYGDGAGGEFGRLHRFIGGGVWNPDDSPTLSCPAYSLSRLLSDHDIQWLSFLKIDCEGCEWSFLDDPAIWRVGRIHGELHPRGNSPVADIYRLLGTTHTVSTDCDASGFGAFRAVAR